MDERLAHMLLRADSAARRLGGVAWRGLREIFKRRYCPDCGLVMRRDASMLTCPNCGLSMSDSDEPTAEFAQSGEDNP